MLNTLDKDINVYCSRPIVSPKIQVFAERKKFIQRKMTEAHVDVIVPIMSELKGASRLVVLLGSPKGIKNVSKKISSLQGVKRIRRGLFIVQGYSETHEAILQFQPFTSFVKSQEIPPVQRKIEDVNSSRVYSIVAFSFNKPTAQQKKRVERLIKKTPGIRLRPGVILFPLLKFKERKRILGSEDERVLIDSMEFNKLVSESGANTSRWSRLRIINLDGENRVTHAIEQTLYRNLSSLEEKILTLRELCKDSTMTIRQLKKNYTTLSHSFQELKTKWMLAKKLWFYDAEKALKRTYNMLITTRRAIISRDTTQN